MENLDQSCKRNVFLDFPYLHAYCFSGQDLRDENHAACLPREAVSSMDQFFNRDGQAVACAELHGIK
jgi:hypothetical protein